MSTYRCYWVYILASKLGGTLYIGVTNDLVRRVYLHRTDAVPGFTKKYQVHMLVYFEQFSEIEHAISGEKRLKNGRVPGKSSSSKKQTQIGMISILQLRVHEY
jgi:putative endonuclease